MQVKCMEFDPVSHGRENILTSSLCDTRDFTSSVDFQDDIHQQTGLSNQDTGYQTASLQSTNPESVSLHTNLTNQFGSLPFNVTNQESVFHTSSQMLTNQDKLPVLNLTHHFSLLAGQRDKDDEGSDIKSDNPGSPLFPKQKLLFLDDEEEEDFNNHETPKNPGCVKLKMNDSALPDESASSQGQMEVDNKLSHLDCLSSQEAVVMRRARQALAMANIMYPQDGTKGVAAAELVPETASGDSRNPEDTKEAKLSASK